MSDAFIQALHMWQNFYFMTGGAAATLIGLLFVAMSLGAHLVSRESEERFNKFITPILFYFASVLFLACFMLVPDYPPFVFGILLALLGIVGLSQIAQVAPAAAHLHPGQPLSWSHFSTNVILPGGAYLLIFLAGAWIEWNGDMTALYALALAAVILLGDGIARSWEVIIWVARQPRDRS